jgi:CDP-diacylglycerol--serine O-phosphatidyltransferase
MDPLRRHRSPRRVVELVPSVFTLGNLFFGMWSIVLASRADYYRAGWFIVIAAVLDMLDGRVARLSGTGSRFGAELDSLVDIVSFGVAPAMLMYFYFFAPLGQFAWLLVYGYLVCVALRLARYNVQSHADEHVEKSFTGLPSPAAGMTLATYYPFTQTAWYQEHLRGLPWSQLLVFMVVLVSLTMVSGVKYARLPRIGFRSVRGLTGLAVNVGILVMAIWWRDVSLFPLCVGYMTYGLLRSAIIGFLERQEQERLGVSNVARLGRPMIMRDQDAQARRREPPMRGN